MRVRDKSNTKAWSVCLHVYRVVRPQFALG